MADERRETEVAVNVDIILGERRVVTEDAVNVDILIGTRWMATEAVIMVDIIKFTGQRRNLPFIQWW